MGDVNKEESGDSRPMGARHGSQSHGFAVRVWLTVCNLQSGCGQTCEILFSLGLPIILDGNIVLTMFKLFRHFSSMLKMAESGQQPNGRYSVLMMVVMFAGLGWC